MIAEQGEFGPQAEEVFRLYKNSRWSEAFASLAFGRPEKYAALQAADLILYEKAKRERSRREDPKVPFRKALDIMGDADIQALDYPHDMDVLMELYRPGSPDNDLE
jgi:hypothetical protein